MVQQETLSLPVQLSSETVQAVVGLLTQHHAWKSHTRAHSATSGLSSDLGGFSSVTLHNVTFKSSNNEAQVPHHHSLSS